MNLTPAIVFGIAGAILILVAAIGGGFSFGSVSIPTVGVFPRMLSLVMGAALAVFAIGMYENDTATSVPTPTAQDGQLTYAPAPAPAPAPPPAPNVPDPVFAPVIAPAGYVVSVYDDTSTSASVVTQVPGGENVAIICTMQGDSVSSDINGVASSLWDGVTTDGATVGFIPDVYLDTSTDQPTMPNCRSMANGGSRA
jgi:hypothetical protein